MGKTIELSGNRFTVVGVASTAFTGLDPILPDFWTPLSAKQLFLAGTGRVSNEADERSLRIIGRLRPGVTEAQARSGMSVAPAGPYRSATGHRDGVSLIAGGIGLAISHASWELIRRVSYLRFR